MTTQDPPNYTPTTVPDYSVDPPTSEAGVAEAVSGRAALARRWWNAAQSASPAGLPSTHTSGIQYDKKLKCVVINGTPSVVFKDRVPADFKGKQKSLFGRGKGPELTDELKEAVYWVGVEKKATAFKKLLEKDQKNELKGQLSHQTYLRLPKEGFTSMIKEVASRHAEILPLLRSDNPSQRRWAIERLRRTEFTILTETIRVSEPPICASSCPAPQNAELPTRSEVAEIILNCAAFWDLEALCLMPHEDTPDIGDFIAAMDHPSLPLVWATHFPLVPDCAGCGRWITGEVYKAGTHIKTRKHDTFWSVLGGTLNGGGVEHNSGTYKGEPKGHKW